MPDNPGHYYDDIDEGNEFDTVGRTITETDMVMHSAMSGNWTELTSNADYYENELDEYVRDVSDRGPFVRGPNLVDIASGLLYQNGVFNRTLLAITSLNVKFRNPVTPGDTVYLRFEVVEKGEPFSNERYENAGSVTISFELIDQHDTIVVGGEAEFLLKRRL